MFDRIKKWLGNAADAVRRMAGIQKVERFEVKPRPLPRRPVFIPRSSFTKKGPGVRARLWAALQEMTPAQRLYCRRKTWDRGMVRPDGSLMPRP
jgi:hypothetical protein